jgi:lipopolysaccharide biosynthesis glycosyltransferase
LLNAEIKKIIYLDSDIIVNESIDKLWNYDITNYAIAAVRDKETLQEQNKKRLGIEGQYSYINAGVEIINLDFLREIDFVNKSLEFVKKHRNKILYHDQDIINALLYKKIFYLPYCWNMMDCYLYKFPQCNPNYTSDIIQYQKNPSIIHFAGRYKPWHKECRNPYRNLYWHYLKKTGIKYFPILRKETTLKRIIKIFFKRLLKDNPYIKLGENNV